MRARAFAALGILCVAGYASAFAVRVGAEGVVPIAEVTCPPAGVVRASLEITRFPDGALDALLTLANEGETDAPFPHVVTTQVFAPGFDGRARVVHSVLANYDSWGEESIRPGEPVVLGLGYMPEGGASPWDSGGRTVLARAEPTGVCALGLV